MKVDYKIVQKRRDDIMMIIQKLGDVTVKQLMNDFDVSDFTVTIFDLQIKGRVKAMGENKWILIK